VEESENNQIELIRKNASLAMETLGPTSGIDFGLNRESVEWVEGFIERQRAREDFDLEAASRLVDVLGSFLGECIIANAGGGWRCDQENGWGIVFSEGNEAYPFNKVRKAFQNGLAGGEFDPKFLPHNCGYLGQRETK
jgi:hypothetical protein